MSFFVRSEKLRFSTAKLAVDFGFSGNAEDMALDLVLEMEMDLDAVPDQDALLNSDALSDSDVVTDTGLPAELALAASLFFWGSVCFSFLTPVFC